MKTDYNTLNKKQKKKVIALTTNIHKLTDFDLGLLLDIAIDELKLRGKDEEYFITRGVK